MQTLNNESIHLITNQSIPHLSYTNIELEKKGIIMTKSASYDSFPTKLLSSEQKEGVRVKRVSNDKPASFLPLPHQFTEHPEEAKEKESNRSNYNAQRISPWSAFSLTSSSPSSPSSTTSSFFTLKGLALETLLARPASTHRLPPHCTIGSSGLLLSMLGRARTRTLSAHRSGARERVGTASAADIDYAGRWELGSCGLWGDL